MSFKVWQSLKMSLSAITICLTSACSPVTVLNAMIPAEGYQKQADIAYGALSRQTLDIYTPVNVSPAQRLKTVLFFYGGSWDSGRKEDYKFVAEALTSAGYIVVIPDYRVYPDVIFPEFMADAAKAVSWTKQHVAQYGGDEKEIYLMGHSAGAHIAAMLTLDKQFLAKQNLSPMAIKGMIGLAGPYDFLPLKSNRLKTIFGPENERWKSQPINFVAGENPPMLLLVGEKDRTVLPRNTYHLADKVKQKGGKVELISFQDYNHVQMISHLAKPLRKDGKLRASIIEFLERN